MSAPAAALPRFSLVRGGPTYRLGLRLGRSSHWPEVRLGIVLAFMTWLPLLILAAIEGVLFVGAVKVSFMASLSSHVRFLVAIPLLFVAEAWIDPRLASFVAQSVDSGLVPASKRAALERATKSAARWRDSVAVEAVILGLAVVLVATGVRVELPAGISPSPLDYVPWTEPVAKFAGRPDLKAKERPVWLTRGALPAGQT
jgi:hypothetical protein